MDLEKGGSAHILKACRELYALPQGPTEAHAHAFFSEFSLERLFKALTSTHDRADLAMVSDTLGRLLATELGSAALPNALPYIEAASTSSVSPLRRLAAELYGSLLMTHAVRQQNVSIGGGSSTAANDDDSSVADTLCMQLVRMLSDPDTDVSAAAAKALHSYGSSSLAALQRLLSPRSPTATALAAAAAAGELGGVVRLRVLALVLEVAAAGGAGEGTPLENGYSAQPHRHHLPSDGDIDGVAASGTVVAAQQYGERLQLLRDSGLLQTLLDQLADPSDALACLSALQLLEDLLAAAAEGGGGGGMAAALAGLVLPQLLTLVTDPMLTDAALPPVAGILRCTLPAAPPSPAAAAALAVALGGNGVAAATAGGGGDGGAAAVPAGIQPVLAAAPALLAAVRAVLDDRGDASAAAEACGLDALGTLGQSAAGAQMVLSDEILVRALCERALGRSPHPEVRMAALHALASAGGLERAGSARDREAAVLPLQSEEALRRGVYSVCGVRRPAAVLSGMLQQPFLELRLAAYRCIAALSLRSWFAVEVVTTPDLYDRITNACSDSGAAACNWRHAAAAALWAAVSAAAAASDEAEYAATLAAAPVMERVRAAVRAGPYGTEAGGAAAAATEAASRMHGEHFVASRGAGGGM